MLQKCHVAKQEIKYISYTIMAVIFTRFSYPSLSFSLYRKTLSDTGRQEIKYNTTKKSCTRRGSLLVAVTWLIRVNSQQSYKVQEVNSI